MNPDVKAYLGSALLFVSLALAPVACEDTAQNQYAALTDLTPDCLTCMQTLAECSSTAQNEAQFVGCRDVFQECQTKMQLGPDECGRPSNEVACDLCRERVNACTGDSCDLEFSVCKAFLMTREQEACKKDVPTTAANEGTCEVCVEALAGCASTGEQRLVCMKTFYTCRNANLIEPADCPDPTDQQACEGCAAQKDSCVASGEEGCDGPYQTCLATLGVDDVCGAGAGGGGTGGGGTGPSCDHAPCEIGAALTADCDPCAAALCATDAFCCDTSWDEYCVQEAQGLSECGCTPPVVCAHDLCTAGDALDPACDPCAQTVCEADGFCCTSGWDELCVGRAGDLCALTCSL